MKLASIRAHLKPYSIVNKRSTTINHAFASAIAPCEPYDFGRVRAAIQFLGQDPDAPLLCLYCGNPAHTWDHLVSLVRNKQLCGYGHQLGNLVPSCRECNSRKGAKDWERFLDEQVPDKQGREKKKLLIKTYLLKFARPLDIEQIEKRNRRSWKAYATLKGRIMDLMAEADKLAAQIRATGLQADG